MRNHTMDGMKSMTWLNASHPGMWRGIQPPKNNNEATPATMKRFKYSAK